MYVCTCIPVDRWSIFVCVGDSDVGCIRTQDWRERAPVPDELACMYVMNRLGSQWHEWERVGGGRASGGRWMVALKKHTVQERTALEVEGRAGLRADDAAVPERAPLGGGHEGAVPRRAVDGPVLVRHQQEGQPIRAWVEKGKGVVFS